MRIQSPGVGTKFTNGRAVLCLGLAIALLAPACARFHHHSDAAGEYEANRLVEYHERYHNPLISPGAQFAALPPAVQRTVRAEAGAASVEDVVKETDEGQILYRIYFVDPGINPPLYVAPDGTLLNPNLTVAIGGAKDTVGVLTGGPVTGITLSDLPPQVVKTIQQRAPDAEVAYITKQVRGDKTDFEIVFKDQRHAPLRIAPDGTVLPPRAATR